MMIKLFYDQKAVLKKAERTRELFGQIPDSMWIHLIIPFAFPILRIIPNPKENNGWTIKKPCLHYVSKHFNKISRVVHHAISLPRTIERTRTNSLNRLIKQIPHSVTILIINNHGMYPPSECNIFSQIQLDVWCTFFKNVHTLKIAIGYRFIDSTILEECKDLKKMKFLPLMKHLICGQQAGDDLIINFPELAREWKTFNGYEIYRNQECGHLDCSCFHRSCELDEKCYFLDKCFGCYEIALKLCSECKSEFHPKCVRSNSMLCNQCYQKHLNYTREIASWFFRQVHERPLIESDLFQTTQTKSKCHHGRRRKFVKFMCSKGNYVS